MKPEPYVVEFTLVPGRRYRLSFVVRRVKDGLELAAQTVEPTSKFTSHSFEWQAFPAITRPRKQRRATARH